MRLGLLASFVCGVVVVGVPAIASAQNTIPQATRSNEDTVTLKDGSVLRGTLTEIAKGAHISLLLSTSQTARVRWDAIVKVERGGVPIDLAAISPNAVPVTPTPVVTAPKIPSGTVRVHIEASREDLELEMDTGGAMNWEVVCTAPCDRDLPLGHVYRINGSGVRKSKPFSLQAAAGSYVTLTVDHGTTAGFVGGIVLTSLGSPVVFVGALITLVGASLDSKYSTDVLGIGLVTTGIGAAVMVPGIVLVANNSGTSVKQGGEGTTSGRAGEGQKVADLPWRTPTWHSLEGPKNPAAPSIPIFSATF